MVLQVEKGIHSGIIKFSPSVIFFLKLFEWPEKGII
jgi:hypothetical protein